MQDKKKEEHKPATAAAPSGASKNEKPPASQQAGRGTSNNAKAAANSKNVSNKPDPYTNITIGHYVLGKYRTDPPSHIHFLPIHWTFIFENWYFLFLVTL